MERRGKRREWLEKSWRGRREGGGKKKRPGPVSTGPGPSEPRRAIDRAPSQPSQFEKRRMRPSRRPLARRRPGRSTRMSGARADKTKQGGNKKKKNRRSRRARPRERSAPPSQTLGFSAPQANVGRPTAPLDALGRPAPRVGGGRQRKSAATASTEPSQSSSDCPIRPFGLSSPSERSSA